MNRYTVHMIQGNDKCSTVTTVEAPDAATAALQAEMIWSGMTVRIVNVEGDGYCAYTEVACTNDHHICDNCNDHREWNGDCLNCDF